MAVAQKLIRGVTGMPMIGQVFNGGVWAGSSAGEAVTNERAVALPAVFKAIRIISETGGALPLVTYRTDGDERERDEDHPTFQLLHEEPNPELSAVEFWTLALAHLTGWGAVFLGKEFRGGTVVALHPIHPELMTVERLASGALIFRESRFDGGERVWTRKQMLYVRLFTVDGVTGLSPIGLQRETMGLAIAMRKHGSHFFRDAAIPAGALTVEGEVKDPATRERIKQEWRDSHKGKRDIALLDAGAKFETISIPLKDAEFVELWNATKADIADTFNMPYSLLGAPTGDTFTYGNREADMQQFLTFTLHNPLKKVEQALTRDRDLFPRTGVRRAYLAEFLREDLLQPDSKARSVFYRMALDPKAGWMTRSEVRRRENLPQESQTEPTGPTPEEE